jgi:hypothetical protein
MTSFRQLWRLACRLHEAWLANQRDGIITPATAEAILDDHRYELRRLAELSRHACRAGWSTAAMEVAERYGYRLVDLCERLRAMTDRLRQPAPRPVTPVDWFRELQQLDAEFDSVDMSWDNRCVIVPTEPITLDDVELGAFVIEFHWDNLSRQRGIGCFEIEAMDPNPAAGNDVVTHSHVRDRALCAGDATTPIAQALAEGRLADAFLLVRSVLRNYNSSSPFVDLEHWNGASCTDCGRRGNPEETYYCEGCDNDVCEDCYHNCSACERSRCGGCLNSCAVCNGDTCSRCLEEVGESLRSCCLDCRVDCSTCGKTLPSDELTEDSSLCPDCESAPEPNDTTDDGAAPTLSAVNPWETLHAIDPVLASAEAGVRTPRLAETPVLLPSG